MLALLLVLFRLTDYRGSDILAEPVNLFFRIDPLIAAAAMLAGKAIIWLFWPAAVVLVLTLIFGRFFCGWICPLGTLLDIFSRIIHPIRRLCRVCFSGPVISALAERVTGPLKRTLRGFRYVLLIFVLATALLGLPLVGYLDPFSLLTRGLAFAVDPAAYNTLGAALDSSSRFYPVIRDYLLPFTHRTYALAGVSAVILAVIFALELIARRFWCRYLCPLGGMIGLVSRFSLLRRVPTSNCGKCPAAQNCAASCRMAAFDQNATFSPDDCTLCMDCVVDCPAEVAKFTFRRSQAPVAPVNLSRRAALTTLAFGLAVPAVVKAARVGRAAPADPYLLRPPGVADQASFLDLCVRCGLCMKVCPTNGLQPAVLQAGIDGIFSPILVPRIGYCEINCTLCGQVCLTGAIPTLTQQQKARTIIGKAVIDTTRCLPWANNEQCICCEEHCPIPEKAIHYDEVRIRRPDGQMLTLQRPYVRLEHCIGCGICETKCPVDGQSAIRVMRAELVSQQPHGQHRRTRARRGRGWG